MKHLFTCFWRLALLVLCSAGPVAAATADLTFNVNMQYQIQQGKFTVGTDAVVVLGSFSSTGVTLTDPDGDKIYSGTVTTQTVDNQLTYNYRFTHSGVTTNETIAAHKYVVQTTTAANVLTDWFNDQTPPYPYAKFFASSIKTIPGEVVRFTDNSDGGAATSWSWTFQGGNPGTSTQQNPTATWAAAGTYAVSLTATNASGSTTQTLSVTVTTVDNALGWWNDAVFYQIYPRSFLDTNGDGLGDLQGMTNKLDYLSKDLGVTALYIMPVHTASNIGYGGYEVMDYKSIATELGTSADFDAFVAAAHTRGMKVILDMVFNHTSAQHPWFMSGAQGAGGKYDNYYVFRATNPGSAWRTNTVAHTDANFNVVWDKFSNLTTPDLNYNTSSVRNTIKDVSSYWLGRGADGFRLDAPMFLYERGDAINLTDQQNLPATYDYWRTWRNHIKAANASAFSVGETWLLGDIPSAAKYVYQGFDIGFQFDVAFGIQDALNNESKSYLQSPLEQSMGYYPFLQFGVMASNHDMSSDKGGANPMRIKDRLTNNQDAKAKVAATFLLTTPGVPFMYFGDEVGAGGGVYGRAPMRWSNTTNAGFTTGSPWTAVGTDYPTDNVASQQADANSIWNLYKSLIAVRKAQAALRRGNYATVTNSTNGVYSYARTYGSETVFVILNLAATAQSNVAFSLNGTAIPSGTYPLDNLLNAAQTAASVTVSGGGIANWVPFASIPANGFYVLKLHNATGGPNSAPTINAVAAQTLNVETGAQSLNLTGISDGDYCSQTVSVTATSSATGVVAAPAVTYTSCNSTGTLKLTPVAAGTATLTVTVTDNGGTANGGVNTKTVSFPTTVTDLPNAPTTLTLSQASATSASVGWTDNSTRETGYKVYWSTAATKPATPNATVAANTTGYTATGLSAQTTYNFWVEAYGANGSSAALTGALTLTLPAYYIINRWKGTYLYDNNSQVTYAATPNGSAYQWTLEADNGNQRIKNVATGRYMNIENQLSYVESTVVDPAFTSSQWVLESYSGYTRIRNVWKGTYVNVENQAGTAQCTAVDATYYSGHWTFQPVSGARTTLSASAPAAKAALTVYPNPISQGSLTLLLPSTATTTHLRLLDGQGRAVLTRQVVVISGQAQVEITGLATGLYLLQATADGITYVSKIAIE